MWFGFATAAAIFLTFGLDLLLARSFRHANVLMDTTYCLCALGLACLSWDTWRDQRFGRKDVTIFGERSQ